MNLKLGKIVVVGKVEDFVGVWTEEAATKPGATTAFVLACTDSQGIYNMSYLVNADGDIYMARWYAGIGYATSANPWWNAKFPDPRNTSREAVDEIYAALRGRLESPSKGTP